MRRALLAAALATVSGCCYEIQHDEACVVNGACFTITRREPLCWTEEDLAYDDLYVDGRTCPGTAYDGETCADLGFHEEL